MGATAMKKVPALEKGAWFGIFLFGVIPFVGAGGFIGTIVGRLIGMRPVSVITAVFCGSVVSGMNYWYASQVILDLF